MAANKKPRKAYRPKPVATQPWLLAAEGAALIPEHKLAEVRAGVDQAVRDMLTGQNFDFACRVVGDAINMACGFNEVGFRVDVAALNAGAIALKAIVERPGHATRHEEREAILTAVACHHAQMQAGMTVGDYEKALKLVKRRLFSYARGNAPKGHVFIKGDLG